MQHSVLSQPNQYTTLKSQDFRGAQRPPLTEAGFLARQSLGPKEGTGYTVNTLPYMEARPGEKDQARFSTNYQHKSVS